MVFFCDTVSGKCDHSELLEMLLDLECDIVDFFCDTASGKCDHSELLEMLLDLKHCGIFL